MPSLLYRTRGGGARLRRPTRERTLYCTLVSESCSMEVRSWCDGDVCRQGSSQPPVSAECIGRPIGRRDTPPNTVVLHLGQTYRTILPWIAQDTQYCSLRYILGTVYSAKTEASEMSPGRKKSQYEDCLQIVEFGANRHTNSSRLNHVADGESLDCLVLGRASRAVAAADGLGVAAALLVAAVVLSL